MQMIYYFGIILILSFIIYSIGHVITSFFELNDIPHTTRLFFKLCIGLVTLVSSYAIIHTNFQTQFIGVLPIFIYTIIYCITKQKIKIHNFRKNIRYFEISTIAIFGVYLLIAVIIFVFAYGVSTNSFNRIESDHSFYSAISVHLQKSKIENFYISDFLNNISTPTFYHYFDLWLNAFNFTLFKITSLHSLIFCIYPLFVALVLLGSFAFANNWFENKIMSFILSFIVLFISSFPQLFQLPLHVLGISSSLNITLLGNLGVKLAIIYLCIIWMFVYSRPAKEFQLLPLALCAVLYPTTLPSISAACLFVFLYDYVTKKQLYWFLFWVAILPLISVVFFYFITSNTPIVKAYDMSMFLKERFLNTPAWALAKISVGNIIELTITRLIPFLPYLLAFIVGRKAVSKALNVYGDQFRLIFFVAIFSILGYGFIYGVQDSTQFVTNFLFPALNVGVFVIGLLLLHNSTYISKAIMFILILLSFYYNQDFVFKENKNFAPQKLDTKTLDAVTNFITNQKFSSAYIRNNSSYTSIFSKNIDLGIPVENFRRYTNSYNPICLSIFSIYPLNENAERIYAEQRIVNSPFFVFTQTNKVKNIDSLQYLFLKNYKIDYLFVEIGNQFLNNYQNLPIEKQIILPDSSYTLVKFNWERTFQ